MDINKQIQAATERLQDSSRTHSTRSKTSDEFSDHEIAMAIYLFNRLKVVYAQKFTAAFKDEATESGEEKIRKARREWAKQIGRYSKEEIDMAIEMAKSERIKGNRKFDWPDIPTILGSIRPGFAADRLAHKRYQAIGIPDLGKQERSKKVGKSELTKMKAAMGL